MMKRISLLLLAALLAVPGLRAQNGAVVYSLPQTVVTLRVKAEREAFTAGPYAAYAQKYLGVAARTESKVSCTLREVTLIPYVEADPKARYAVTIPDKASSGFLQLCAQGLVVMADNYTGKPADWHFRSPVGSESFAGVDPLGNLGRETTTLYKAVRTDDGYERVPVTQEQVVERSADRKAADAAALIFDLRTKRRQIATGDTDATFSGEALQAAIDEITRTEESLLTLFYGVSEISVEEKTFDVVPQAGSTQRYTAFRIGDSLLPAGAADGRPVTVEFKKEALAAPEAAAEARGGKEGPTVRYRVPAVAQCRVLDGGDLLLESRIPVYQLGEELLFPLSVLATR